MLENCHILLQYITHLLVDTFIFLSKYEIKDKKEKAPETKSHYKSQSGCPSDDLSQFINKLLIEDLSSYKTISFVN